MEIRGTREKYARIELSLPNTVQYVEVTAPTGEIVRLKPFEHCPIRILYDEEGFEHVSETGKRELLCRYTPDFCGKAIFRAYSDEKAVEQEEVYIADSNDHGYIASGRKDSKYFSYTDGTPFFVIGINTAFPTSYVRSNGKEFGTADYGFMGLKQYERWFAKLSKNGVNVARIWLGHEYFTPDTDKAYCLELKQFSKLDKLLELAKTYGIKLKLTLEQFRFFDYSTVVDPKSYSGDVFRKFNKQLTNGSERCVSTDEWLTSEKWEKAWLYKIEEFAKRYAGDTQIFAIELWNEMNNAGSWKNMLAWNRRVLPKIRALFPKNMVANSLGSLDCEYVKELYESFCWDLTDFVQIHRYLDQGAKYPDCTKDPTEVIKGAFEKFSTEKPLLIAETGAVNNCHSGPFKYYSCDDDGLLFADMVYTPLFMKSCGIGNIWHWDERYVESKNLYGMFHPICELTKNVDFENESFEPLELSTEEVLLLLLKGRTCTLGYIRNKRYSWQNVLRDNRSVSAIKSVSLPRERAERVRLFPIWNHDTTTVTLDEKEICFSDIQIGTLFRIENQQESKE